MVYTQKRQVYADLDLPLLRIINLNYLSAILVFNKIFGVKVTIPPIYAYL